MCRASAYSEEDRELGHGVSELPYGEPEPKRPRLDAPSCPPHQSDIDQLGPFLTTLLGGQDKGASQKGNCLHKPSLHPRSAANPLP